MRKILSLISGSSIPLAFAAFPPAAYAINTCPKGQFDVLCNLTAGNFGNIVGGFIQLVFVIATVAALFYLIYGGLKWILSEGDKSSVEAARNHIVASIVGLIIIFLAYFILNIVIGFFIPTASLNNLQLPTLIPQAAPGS